MPRPNSAEAAIQFYNRGGGGFRLHTPPNLVLELTPKSERKSTKRVVTIKTERAKKGKEIKQAAKGAKKVSIVETAKSVEGLKKRASTLERKD